MGDGAARVVYQVRDWDEHFENNKSRERDECSFVCVPNKQDGLGLTYVLSEPDGGSLYGIWCLILGACSRQRRQPTPAGPRRQGYLTDNGLPDGRPWSARDMALRWRRRPEEIQRALDLLCSAEVGWMRVVDAPADAIPLPPNDLRPSARVVPAECPPGTLEGKGIEEKGSEGDSPPDPPGGAGGDTTDRDGAVVVAAGKQPTPAPAEPPGFVQWWAEYPRGPRKVGRSKCLRIWGRRGLEGIADKVIVSLRRCIASRDWRKEGGAYIPGPEPWLNNTPWETDPEDLTPAPAAPPGGRTAGPNGPSTAPPLPNSRRMSPAPAGAGSGLR